ncbi:MAG: DUF1893 domain-containing protein [Oscillospiraceae bacterium]|nr:DUF1893 domain-containing protein [Oscillospiraceae bacterium]
MVRTKTQTLTMAGLLTALGILLPLVTSHMFGLQGTILLPMHLPVLLLGLLCGPYYGLVGGAVIPLLSSALTGMPAYPMVIIMTGELMTYGLISGLLRKKAKLPTMPALVLAMVCGRITYGLIFAALLTANDGVLRAASVTTAVAQGIPGIIIQLVLIPIVVRCVEMPRRRAPREVQPDWAQVLSEQDATCVVMRDGVVIHKASGNGVKPLMALVDGAPELLRDAFVIDKIIGKAAAMLLVKCGASQVHGVVMSEAACAYLERHGVAVSFGRCIDVISNRTGNGICPLEQSVLEIDDPEEGYQALKQTISRLMGA